MPMRKQTNKQTLELQGDAAAEMLSCVGVSTPNMQPRTLTLASWTTTNAPRIKTQSLFRFCWVLLTEPASAVTTSEATSVCQGSCSSTLSSAGPRTSWLSEPTTRRTCFPHLAAGRTTNERRVGGRGQDVTGRPTLTLSFSQPWKLHQASSAKTSQLSSTS